MTSHLSTAAYEPNSPDPVDEAIVTELVDLIAVHGSHHLVPGVPSAQDRAHRLQHAAFTDHLAILAARAAAAKVGTPELGLDQLAETAVNRAQSWATILLEFDLYHRSSRGTLVAQDIDQARAGGEGARRYVRQEWIHRPHAGIA